MVKSPPAIKESESKLITQLEAIASRKKHSLEILAVTRNSGFDRYYPLHCSGILKRRAWTLYAEDGQEYEHKSLDIGAYLHNLPDTFPPELTVRIPPKIFDELGFNKGDNINHFCIFVEPFPPAKIKIYVAKAHHQWRGMTNAKWRKKDDELYALLKDYDPTDDY